ncbi:hypothetical protein DVH24_024203 [Malus domestica]|uniref:Uncharacterized protein n=1 Tax=Malus domestica TaxID=3750 RepID=A0A498JF97_MALDO|nr:hypothetical protein DVH24_024203 [Malus domestica]
MKSHAFHVLQFLFILRGMNRKTNKKGLKTLSFNDKDKIKGKVKSTRADIEGDLPVPCHRVPKFKSPQNSFLSNHSKDQDFKLLSHEVNTLCGNFNSCIIENVAIFWSPFVLPLIVICRPTFLCI